MTAKPFNREHRRLMAKRDAALLGDRQAVAEAQMAVKLFTTDALRQQAERNRQRKLKLEADNG